MPQHKSCIKRLRQDVVRRERNRGQISTLRSAIRRFRSLSATERAGAYDTLQSTLDRAVGKGILSANRAARLKSRLRPAV